MKIQSIFTFCTLSFFFQVCCHAGPANFKVLDEEKCTQLTQDDTLKLPVAYHRYVEFLKLCKFQKNNGGEQSASGLISIWAHDFTRSKGERSAWEDFPPSVLVDGSFKVIGKLPELYPMDWATHLAVSYGKWHAGRPEEIRVDVTNPAVSGDYYYAPLRWNRAKERYEMTSQEPIPGKRHK